MTTKLSNDLLEPLDKQMVGLGNVDNTSDANKPVSIATQAALNAKAPLASPAFTGTPTVSGAQIETRAARGAANGYAPLGSDGKVLSINLPDNGSYKGNWNASTNSPVITAGTGTNGDTYTVSVAGTQSVTGTSIAFAVGDQLRFTTNGNKWERIPNAQTVASVAGLIGTIQASDLKTALAITKTDAGLANVDNTSDANKPVSTATQLALDTLNTTIMKRGPKFSWISGESRTALTTRAQNFFNESVVYGGGDWMAGEFAINCGLTVVGDVELNFSESAAINFEASTVNSDSILIGSPTVTALPALADDIVQYSDTVTFVSPPALNPGDWVVFWNDTINSWMSTTISGDNRAYYKEGEYKRVWSITGNTVLFDTAFLYGYSKSVISSGLVPTNKVRMYGGRFTGLYHESSDRSLFVCNNLEDSNIDVRATHAERAILDLRRCFETYARVQGHDYGPSVSLNYGISAIACHKVSLSGSLRTRRHAISITGGGITASVPNRDVVFRDGFLAGSAMAFDCHGATDGAGIENSFIDGGAVFGGDKTFIRNCDVTTSLGSEDLGVAIKFRERKGMTHTIENTRIRVMSKASGGKYIVHLQGDTTADIAAVHDFGGVVRISGLTIISDYTSAISNGIAIRGGSSQRVDIDVSNIKYVSAATQKSTQLRFDTTGTPGYDTVSIRDCDEIAIRSFGQFKARRITLNDLRCSLSPNNGIYLSIGTPDTRTDINISNAQIDSSYNAGIMLVGVANTDRTFVTINGGYSINNSQYTSTTSNYRSGVVLTNLNNVIINGMAIGDDQVTQTQTRRITYESCANVTVNSVVNVTTSLTSGVRSDLLVNMEASALKVTGRPNKIIELGDESGGSVTVASAAIVRWITDLSTANRTASISDVGAAEGDEIRFERPAGGSYTLTINSTITLATGQGIVMRKRGVAGWYLASRYSLT